MPRLTANPGSLRMLGGSMDKIKESRFVDKIKG